MDSAAAAAAADAAAFNSQPLETFPLFTRLPPELRLNIWELNLPSTRLVPIQCGSDISAPLESASDDNRDGRWPPLSSPSSSRRQPYVTGCTTSAPIPVNLYVCAESRAHALSRYKQALGFARTSGRVYFRPATDILYFGGPTAASTSTSSSSSWMAAGADFNTCMALVNPAQVAQFRRIAIDEAMFSPGGPGDGGVYSSMVALSLTTECLRQIRARMPCIEEVIFVPRAAETETDANANAANPARATLALQVYTALQDLQYGDRPVHIMSSPGSDDRCHVWCPPRFTILANPITNGTLFNTEMPTSLRNG